MYMARVCSRNLQLRHVDLQVMPAAEEPVYKYQPIRPPVRPKKGKPMNVTRVIVKHSTDNAHLAIDEIYLTEDHQLCVVGTCRACGKSVWIEIPMRELYDTCPLPEAVNAEAEALELHALGIKYEPAREAV